MACFFSKAEPTSGHGEILLRVKRLPLPDTKTICALVELSRQAWLDGFKSVRYEHLSDAVQTSFPLWVITFWNEVLDVREIAAKWAACSDWVLKQTKQTQFQKRGDLAQEAFLLLSVLPWGIKKPSGLSDALEVHTLWRFLGDHWLSCSQQNDLLKILRQKVASNPNLAARYRIKGVDLTPKVLAAFRAKAENYQTSANYSWLRRLGADLVLRKSTLLTTAHLGDITSEPHWVGFAIDLAERAMLYGDSMGTPVPNDLYAAYI
ncbi:hypothetical protein Hypma_014170 [Hypsizygus marmoreus]|uniref:Uncharacterized protein n=1 Tax=Hypsizygus marmoreus TaxID=39966 RepID=A0A369K5S1_HYPMA|nr:hypothetical protein Hypma_014170 [Hypsizygus marmoreus]